MSLELCIAQERSCQQRPALKLERPFVIRRSIGPVVSPLTVRLPLLDTQPVSIEASLSDAMNEVNTLKQRERLVDLFLDHGYLLVG